EIKKEVERFCEGIVTALHARWEMPEAGQRVTHVVQERAGRESAATQEQPVTGESHPAAPAGFAEINTDKREQPAAAAEAAVPAFRKWTTTPQGIAKLLIGQAVVRALMTWILVANDVQGMNFLGPLWMVVAAATIAVAILTARRWPWARAIGFPLCTLGIV